MHKDIYTSIPPSPRDVKGKDLDLGSLIKSS